MAESGRRERIMIACVTFETVMVTDPIKFYESTKVHLIHYINEASASKQVYLDFYNTVCDQITDYSSEIEIIEHKANVSDFRVMLKEIHSIVDKERQKSNNNDIFINVSSGSSEYLAAATIVAMMFPGVIPFSVSTNEFMVNAKAYYDDNGKPIGLSKSVKEPKSISRFKIDGPDRNLVLGLRLLYLSNSKGKKTKGSEMIRLLKLNNLWFRGEFPEKTAQRSESVYYNRDFVSEWLKKDWVFQDKHSKTYILTENGKATISTFYCDEKLQL